VPKIKRTVLFEDPRQPKPGRPPKLTVELQEKICKVVMAGAPLSLAAAAVGIPERTLRIWRAKGERERAAGGGRHAAFLDAFEEARGQRAFIYANAITTAALAGDWKAAAFMLSKTVPSVFGDKSTVNVQLREDRDRLLQAAQAVLPRELFIKLLTALSALDDPERNDSTTEDQVDDSEDDGDGA
jgi:hypothetical protein